MKKLLSLTLITVLLLSGCTSKTSSKPEETSSSAAVSEETTLSSNQEQPSTTISETTPAETSEIKKNTTPEAGEEIQIDYKIYDALISEWKTSFNKYRNGESTWNDMLYFNFFFPTDSVNSAEAYYALYDIDGNGIMELILNKRNGSENVNAYIFAIKDGEAINVFGHDDKGLEIQVPWSKYGFSDILDNGLIDCRNGNYGIYKIADDGYTVIKIASSEPYDYPSMADLASASWRYYVNDTQVEYDFYVQYLNEQGYTINGNNTLAIIDWINIE